MYMQSSPTALAAGAASIPGQPPGEGGFFTPQRPPRPAEMDVLEKLAAMPNAAARQVQDGDELISQETLDHISAQVKDGYERDKASRHEWEEEAKLAMEAAKQRRQSKDYPFPNAANVQYPIITIAAMQFNARAYPAICTGQNVVKCRISGSDQDGSKASRGMRVQQYMSHQIVDGMEGGWEHDMDVLLYQLPIIGDAFKKSYWDVTRNTCCTSMISAFDFVVNADTKDLRSCPRMSHRFPLYPYEIQERMRSGTFLDLDLDQIGGGNDDQEPVWFIEQHCYYDLDDDGYAEPWIVTQTEEGGELARITAAFDPLDIIHDGVKIIAIPRDQYFSHFYFLPDPEGGFYGIGFGHLLRSFGDVIDTSFNQMLDAGHLQNAGGGFIGDGLDFQNEQEEFRFEPGKYHNVSAEGGDIRQQVYNMDFAGPSPVLFQLLGMMIDASKQITSVQDILTGSASAQTMQPTTLMALIDQGMKAFTAVYKRVYDGLTCEFRIQYKLNRRYLSDDDYNKFLGIPQMAATPGAQPGQTPQPQQQQFSVADDFADDGCLVVPVADPNSVTMAQRMAKASFLQQLLSDPKLGPMLDPHDILMRVLAAGDIEDLPSCLAKPSPPTPADQIQLQTALANIALLKSEADHNAALAATESAKQENFQAKSADLIASHGPDFYKNPPVQQVAQKMVQ